MEPVSVKKLNDQARLPSYGSSGAAGADLYACLDTPVEIGPGMSAWIPTGISLAIPQGCAGLVYARSGLACKQGLAPANKVGVIDSDYRGEVMVVLHNHGSEPRCIQSGERIAQLVITPVFTPLYEEAAYLPSSDRGTGGFGSTGR